MKGKTMNQLLDALCNSLDDELERQENVLAVCRVHGEAARGHDLAYMEAKTAALEVLIRDAAQASAGRQPLLREIVAHFELPEERQSLTGLIQAAPDPWRSRLRQFQHRFRATLGEIRTLVRENMGVMRKSLKAVTQYLGALEQGMSSEAEGYSAEGLEPRQKDPGPALIDRKG